MASKQAEKQQEAYGSDQLLWEDEEYSDRPSYLPDTVADGDIPDSLREETAFWTTGKGQVLSPESTKALMESEALLTTLYQNEDAFKVARLNPNSPGHMSLKGHCTRVAVLSLLINDGLKKFLSPMAADAGVLAKSALLHDYGKMNPEVNRVVMSNERYGKDHPAWEIIRRHPRLGAELAMAMPGLESGNERFRVADAIFQHHERHDGSGYYGLPASRIIRESAIIAVADTIDAMGENRSYKGPIASGGVMKELEKCHARYDSDVLETIRRMRHISGVFMRHRSQRP